MKTLINIILFTVLVQTLTAAPVKSWTYAYNDTGAREQVVEDGELTDDTINIAGQVISRTGLPENSYAYDNDGNLESDPNWDYIFNEANQLVRMDNKEAVGYTVTFSYDYSGRRYQKSVLLEDVLTERTTYVYDGQRVIAEIDSLEEAVEDHELEKTYTHGLYIDEVLAYTDHVDDLNSETYYVTTDRQFSTRAVVDSLGDVIEERNYDPFGKDYNDVAESSDLAYGFTGRRYDQECNLYYFRARYYSTELGQFISRDPLEYVDGMSMYSGYFARQFAMDPFGEHIEVNLESKGNNPLHHTLGPSSGKKRNGRFGSNADFEKQLKTTGRFTPRDSKQLLSSYGRNTNAVAIVVQASMQAFASVMFSTITKKFQKVAHHTEILNEINDNNYKTRSKRRIAFGWTNTDHINIGDDLSDHVSAFASAIPGLNLVYGKPFALEARGAVKIYWNVDCKSRTGKYWIVPYAFGNVRNELMQAGFVGYDTSNTELIFFDESTISGKKIFDHLCDCAKTKHRGTL